MLVFYCFRNLEVYLCVVVLNLIMCRKLGVQEDELKRAIERAEFAENKLKGIEEELQTVTDLVTFYLQSFLCWSGW